MNFPRTLLICLLLVTPAAAQETVRAIELPRATLGELAAVPLREQAPRVVQQRWLPPLRGGGGQAILPVREAATEEGQAGSPVLHPALVFASDSSTQLSPPDASGAVGPHHVVGAFNSGIVVHDRAGALLKKVGLSQFWFSNAAPATYYDPRIVYDAAADRWVVMSILDEKAVMIAVSETGDPTGAWRRYQIDEHSIDFSHLVLTGDSIVATTVYWPLETSIYFVIPRAVAYANPATLTATRVAADTEATPVASESDEELIITADTSRVSWRALDGDWQHADLPPGWSLPNENLPQLGAPPLDGGIGIIETAVERNGWIYAVMARTRTGSSYDSILWCRVNRTTGASEWGSLTGPAFVSYGYPSLAVNRSGAMLIGFGVFSQSTYASSAFVYRSPLGTMTAPETISAGDAAVTVGDRWGDYTTTLVDPLDGNTFWTVQMHARRNTFWETSWARVDTGGGRRRAARH